jgi:hypothetical protein
MRPETVGGWEVEPQFSGSIFDLRPATSYEIKLRLTDPDEEVDQTFALTAAKAGDVIALADGVYDGTFVLRAAGTAENPIVVRGASQEGTILDAGNCESCNVLEVYGAGFVQIERLTLRNANRGLRFQTAGAEGNVVRRVSILNTRLGIGSQTDQKDFYIADNILEGRLKWPNVYTDDNGVELDSSEANARCLRNRFTNTYATLSVQPIYGGPAYLIRNIVVNVTHEQMKFHALGGTPLRQANGIFAYHNTFVSPGAALNLETSDATHHFVVANNIFVGGPTPPNGRTVNWTGPIDDGVFDYNGYFPDGGFTLNLPLAQGGYSRFANFAGVQRGGIETHGLMLELPIFANGLEPPASYTVTLDPQETPLDAASNAVDRRMILPNVNDAFTGAAPDLGALELGCPVPLYGPRPEGIDETNEPLGCELVWASPMWITYTGK